MDNTYYENKEKALNWWKQLSTIAQVNLTNSWQKQLTTDFMKSWHFAAISKSDFAITRIWGWSQAIKAKSIDLDILTDKKY